MDNSKNLAILRGKHLKSALLRFKLKQVDLTRDGMITESQVSDWIKGKICISEPTLKDIQEKYLKNVRMDYLLGYDEFMTLEEYKKEIIPHQEAEAVTSLLHTAFYTVCNNENIPLPDIDIPEELLLQALLKDYACSLARNYLHRKESPFWSWFDYVESVRKEKEELSSYSEET